MTVSLSTQRDRLGLGATQVDKVTGHVISHQLSDKSRPAILFQQEQPGLLCMRPGSAESRVSAVLLLGTSSPSRQFILAQVQDETLTPPPPPPRLGGPWLLLTLPCTALEGKHVCGTRQGVWQRGRPKSKTSSQGFPRQRGSQVHQTLGGCQGQARPLHARPQSLLWDLGWDLCCKVLSSWRISALVPKAL